MDNLEGKHDVRSGQRVDRYRAPRCVGVTPTGGAHGNLHPTARIHRHARQRGCRLAPRRTSVANGDAGGRISALQLARADCGESSLPTSTTAGSTFGLESKKA